MSMLHRMELWCGGGAHGEMFIVNFFFFLLSNVYSDFFFRFFVSCHGIFTKEIVIFPILCIM